MYLFFWGFTGLVGSNVLDYFISKSYFKKIFLFTRKSKLDPFLYNFDNIEIIKYSYLNKDLIKKIIDSNFIKSGEFLVFNFVGENIFGYINKSKYERIYNSRVEFNKELVKIFNELNIRPYIYLSASAIGYYSNLIDIEDEIDENYFIRNNILNYSLMSKLCFEWERVTHDLIDSNVFNLRLGVVLDKKALFVKLFKLNSYLGFGLTFDDPFLPWIYSKEIPSIIDFLIEYTKSNNLSNIKQAVNVVNPNILRFSEFLKILINKNKILPFNFVIKIPRVFIKLILKLLMGNYYEIPFSLLISLNVSPKFLLDKRYIFKYNDLNKLEL
ncbi:MAG: NAD-dependent epimerase/dehydratase family protein [bacterium]